MRGEPAGSTSEATWGHRVERWRARRHRGLGAIAAAASERLTSREHLWLIIKPTETHRMSSCSAAVV
jgi:hypothetical protein